MPVGVPAAGCLASGIGGPVREGSQARPAPGVLHVVCRSARDSATGRVHRSGAAARVGGWRRPGQLRGADGHPQDQARDRHHAGEPVLRQLLRHLPRGGRHPDAPRCAHGLRAEPGRWVHAPLPRHRRRQRRRPARRGQRGRRHQPRQDERLHPAAGRGKGVLQDSRRPGLQRRQRRARRDGLPHRRGDTELLGLRQELRAAGPHVRAGEVVVAARAPVHGLRLVGAMQEPLADELRQRHRRSLRGQHVRRARCTRN